MIDLRRLLEHASANAGVIHRSALEELGVTRHQLQRLRRDDLVVPIGTNTFTMPGLGDPWKATVAACLEVDGAASHETAARLHEIGRWPHAHRPHVVAHRSNAPRHHLGFATVHTTTWLPPDDVLMVQGVRCTSVARTLLMLAAPRTQISDERLRDLVDEAVRDQKASDAWLWWRLERLRRRGRGGIRRLELVLAARGAGALTESWLERTFLALLVQHGLPLPICQQRIERRGAFVGRVDFLYLVERIVIEVSGHEFHSSREQLARDAVRRNELQLAGHTVLEFTYDQVVRHPEQVIATLLDARALR